MATQFGKQRQQVDVLIGAEGAEKARCHLKCLSLQIFHNAQSDDSGVAGENIRGAEAEAAIFVEHIGDDAPGKDDIRLPRDEGKSAHADVVGGVAEMRLLLHGLLGFDEILEADDADEGVFLVDDGHELDLLEHEQTPR